MASGKPNFRQIQVEKRRQQILDNALLVFAEKGYANTTIRDLANAADISIGLIYNYFPSKDKLLEEVVERHDFLPQLRIIFQSTKELSCHEAFRYIAFGFTGLVERGDSVIKIFLQEGNINTKVQQIWANFVYESVSLFIGFFSDRIGTGELKHHNTEVSARCLFSILMVFHLTRGIYKRDKVTKVQFIDNVIECVSMGIEINCK